MAARAVCGCQPKAFWICAIVAPDFLASSLRNWSGRVDLVDLVDLVDFGLAIFGVLPLACGRSGLSVIIFSTQSAPALPVPCTERSPGIPSDVYVMDKRPTGFCLSPGCGFRIQLTPAPQRLQSAKARSE